MPTRLTRPKVGFRPTMPQRLAGIRIEPPVSLPVAAMQKPAATAAAEPPEEPPGTRSVFHGLRVGGVTVPQAYSCVVVLPRKTAPALRSRATAAASTRGKETPGALVPVPAPV